MERLVDGRIRAVVLDLTLPDCEGLDGFVKVSSAAPHLPVLILGAVRDEGLAQQAVRAARTITCSRLTSTATPYGARFGA